MLSIDLKDSHDYVTTLDNYQKLSSRQKDALKRFLWHIQRYAELGGHKVLKEFEIKFICDDSDCDWKERKNKWATWYVSAIIGTPGERYCLTDDRFAIFIGPCGGITAYRDHKRYGGDNALWKSRLVF